MRTTRPPATCRKWGQNLKSIEQGLASTTPWVKSRLLPVFVHQVLLEYSRDHLFTYLLFSRSVASDSWHPMDCCGTPGLPGLHHLPELAQTHVHWVSDAIQPPYLLSSDLHIYCSYFCTITAESYSCDRDYPTHKYLLSGPLKKRFADSCYSK